MELKYNILTGFCVKIINFDTHDKKNKILFIIIKLIVLNFIHKYLIV